MVNEYGAEQRTLLETTAVAIFERAATAGYLRASDISDDEQVAFELLVDLGLLLQEAGSSTYAPVDPAIVQARVVGPLGQRGAVLLNEASQWARSFETVGRSYRRAANESHPITELRGLDNINRFMDAALEDATSELLTAQPTVGRSAAALERAAIRDIRTVERGVAMRTLYQHSARRSLFVQEYVEKITPHGAHVRTLEEFFNRLIVVDRSLAVVPGIDGGHVAVAIREPALVAYLADIFERYWERARPFDDRAETTRRIVAADVRNMTLRLLIEGHSDPASAKRMGVSTRTYAGYIAALKAEFAVQTRFQLGYALGLDEDRGSDFPTSADTHKG